MKFKLDTFKQFEEHFFIFFDSVLITGSGVALIILFFAQKNPDLLRDLNITLAILSFTGLIPVAISAFKALINRRLSVDLLATIALVFSLLAHEWASAAFITLMLAFARIFDLITEARAKKTIQSLMKYHVEWVRVRIGDSVKDVHISAVKKGDLVIIESGDRVPVDGIVNSGQADVDESSLTGESELVPKKSGDKVFTSTINVAGSLIVRTERIGADTTLSKMIALVEEASRDKNQAELTADKFTQWYILIALVGSATLYFLNIELKTILSILLVICADDIAVAIPLAYTSAISYAARRGVIVKGSSAFEQLSRMKYVLTDKTGTLTKGKPKVVDVRSYGKWTREEIAKRFVSGAAESKHAVSRAIMEYAAEYKIKPHVPDELQEIPGQGLSFTHDGEAMLMGRASFIESRGCKISDQIKKDIQTEKDSGRGIVCLTVGGEIAGVLSYIDELRPRVAEIIRETRSLGVKEWHMLTGDNERAASAVAKALEIRHFHANLTPEGKVDFIRKFEHEHGPLKGKLLSNNDSTDDRGVVGYIGDGVNDAATLALADVSIAMGGIGADAAIEASDITIMKDHFDRVPETMMIANKVRRVMRIGFWIWGITNVVGLLLVVIGLPGFGKLGPAEAAVYNFLTDFIPIANAMRAGRK